MPRPRSLKSRLAASYAAVALIAALIFGTILAVSLPPFFNQIELQYARSVAANVSSLLEKAGGFGPDRTEGALTVIRQAAQAERARVRLFGRNGALVADSGSPSADRHSKVVFTDVLRNRDGMEVGRIEISEVPRSGAGLTPQIMWAWIAAGALSVLGAGLFGVWLADRISNPISDLTRVSMEMAEGDLSVRAPVEGDAEVATLAASFNEMADGIEDTFDSLTRFVGDAAHEIGTPLTALQADLELAREAPDSANVPELLDRSIAHSGRIAALTRDLLALSRLESVGAIAEQPVDLSELASLAVDGVASRAEQADVELESARVDSALIVLGDPSALARALDNLLDNAVKFTPVGGRVSLSARRANDVARIVVSDTGPGIPLEDLPHVFERFHRSRHAAPIPGSGLGLAIVRAIALAHGGAIHVESSPSGTAFTVTLPLAHGSAPASNGRNAPR